MSTEAGIWLLMMAVVMAVVMTLGLLASLEGTDPEKHYPPAGPPPDDPPSE